MPVWLALGIAIIMKVASPPSALAEAAISPSSTSSDIGALKRLTREVFGELVSVRDRLTKLEAGPESEDELVPEPRGDVSIRAGRWSRRKGRPAKARAKVELLGLLEGGVHVPWSSAPHGRTAVTKDLSGVGLRSGPTTFLTLQKVFREAGQWLYARAALRGNSSFSITEAIYKAELLPQLRVMLALQGGSLDRLAPTLNPFSEFVGLTRLVRKGHAIDGVSEQGTGAAVCLLSSPFTISAGSFLQANSDGSAARVSSVQAGIISTEQGALHLAATSRAPAWKGYGPTPRESRESATSTASSLRYQGLLAPFTTSVAAPSGTAAPSQGEATTEVGVAGALKVLPGIAVSGWASRHLTASSTSSPYGAALHALPDSSGHSATVAIGYLPPAPGLYSRPPRLVAELSAKLAASDGLLVVPGMVMVQQGSSRSMCVSVQTSWRF